MPNVMRMLLVSDPDCLLARYSLLGSYQTVSASTLYGWIVRNNKLCEMAGQHLLCIVILTHNFLGPTEKVNYVSQFLVISCWVCNIILNSDET